MALRGRGTLLVKKGLVVCVLALVSLTAAPSGSFSDTHYGECGPHTSSVRWRMTLTLSSGTALLAKCKIQLVQCLWDAHLFSAGPWLNLQPPSRSSKPPPTLPTSSRQGPCTLDSRLNPRGVLQSSTIAFGCVRGLPRSSRTFRHQLMTCPYPFPWSVFTRSAEKSEPFTGILVIWRASDTTGMQEIFRAVSGQPWPRLLKNRLRQLRPISNSGCCIQTRVGRLDHGSGVFKRAEVLPCNRALNPWELSALLPHLFANLLHNPLRESSEITLWHMTSRFSVRGLDSNLGVYGPRCTVFGPVMAFRTSGFSFARNPSSVRLGAVPV